MQDESFAPMEFPARGVDVSEAFDEQRQLTTPVGTNVRLYEPSTMRARGGSRSGLTKFIEDQPDGSKLIQHLNVIVDPTVDALIADDDGSELTPIPSPPPVPPDEQMDDPSDNPFGTGALIRNNGRRIRIGGSGRQANRNRPSKTKPAITSITPFSFVSFYGTAWTDVGGTIVGTTLTINGTNLGGMTAVVKFKLASGDKIAVVVSNTGTVLVVTIPVCLITDADLSFHVTVTTTNGTSTQTAADLVTMFGAVFFTMDTHTGTSAGGTTVTITGAFPDTSFAVFFGATPAASVTVIDGSTLQAVSPAYGGGPVHVNVTLVTHGYTAGAADPVSGFTYT